MLYSYMINKNLTVEKYIYGYPMLLILNYGGFSYKLINLTSYILWLSDLVLRNKKLKIRYL